MTRASPGVAAAWLERHLASDHHGADCVEWPFATLTSGYGVLAIDGSNVRVTHIVLERTGRPRPAAPANCALHSCDVKSCVNPRHLRWGTQLENVADKVKRARAAKGETNGNSVLTAEHVRAIRARHTEGGVTQRALAAEYGVSPPTISLIVNHHSWTHLKD